MSSLAELMEERVTDFYFGVDPGKTCTVISLFWGGEFRAYATIEFKKATTKLGTRFVASFFNIFQREDARGVLMYKVSTSLKFEPEILNTYEFAECEVLSELSAYRKQVNTVLQHFSELIWKAFDINTPLKRIEFTGEFIVGLEMPYGHHMGKGSDVDKSMVALYYAISEWFLIDEIPGKYGWICQIHNNSFKKEFTGKGNASKAVIIKEAYKQNFDTDIDDVADSFGLGKVVIERHGRLKNAIRLRQTNGEGATEGTPIKATNR